MYVVTLQNSVMLDRLFEGGDLVYPLPFLNRFNWNRKEMKARDIYFKKYNEFHKTDYKNFFWVFTNIIGDEGRPLDITRINKELLELMCSKIGINENAYSDYYYVLLEVPDDIVLETDFYDYSDSIYDIELYPFTDELFNINKEKRDTQGILPYIKQDWIVTTHGLGKPFDECYGYTPVSFKELRKCRYN